MKVFKKLMLMGAVAVFVFVLSTTVANAAQKMYGSLVVQDVVNVYDGDSFRVNIKGLHPLIGENIGIRVYGVDTPEMRGKCPSEKAKAIIARDYVKSILNGARKIELREVRRDKYFRIDAVVVVDGRSLAAMLISNGYARQYFGKTKEGWC